MINHNLKNLLILLLITILVLETISSQNHFLDKNSITQDISLIETQNLLDIENFYIEGKNCTVSNCPRGQGICLEDRCLCSYGFLTYNSPDHQHIYCNYKQKSRLMAFFLEFFFPIGIGHAYAGKIYLAIFKFSLFFILICGTCGEVCCLGFEHNKIIVCSAIFIVFTLLLWIALSFFDLFAYAFGFYLDGNGLPMI